MRIRTYRGFERPQTENGQAPAPADLPGLGVYVRDKLRAALGFLAGPGVASGLAVGPTTEPSTRVVVQPGYAVDPAGNDLYLESPAEVDLAGLLRESAAKGGDGDTVYLLVRRTEEAPEGRDRPCPSTDWRPRPPRAGRILEGVSFEVRRGPAEVPPWATGGRDPRRDGALALAAAGKAGMGLIRVVSLEAGPVALATGRQGHIYAAVQGRARLEILDPDRDKPVDALDLEAGRPRALDVSGDGHLVVSLDGMDPENGESTKGAILRLDADSGEAVGEAVFFATGAPRHLACAPQGGYCLAVEGGTGRVHLLHGDQRVDVRDLGGEVGGDAAATIGGLAVARDGVAFASLPAAGTVVRFRFGDGFVGAPEAKAEGLAGPRALTVAPDGEAVYACLRDSGAVVALHACSLAQEGIWSAGGSPVSVLAHPDRTRLFLLCRQPDQVTVLHTLSGAPLATLIPGRSPAAAVFDKDAHRLVVGNGPGNSLSVFDLTGRALDCALEKLAAGPAACGPAAGIPLARIRLRPARMEVAAADIDDQRPRSPLLNLRELTRAVIGR